MLDEHGRQIVQSISTDWGHHATIRELSRIVGRPTEFSFFGTAVGRGRIIEAECGCPDYPEAVRYTIELTDFARMN